MRFTIITVVFVLLAFAAKVYAVPNGTGNDIFTGNVGIGTTTPQAALVSMGNVGIGTWTAAGGNLIVNGGGNVGIGTALPPNALYVKGTMEGGGFKLDGNGLGSGYILTSNSVGVGTWMPAPASSGGGIGAVTQVLLGGPANAALTSGDFNALVLGSANQGTEANAKTPVSIAGIFKNFCLTTTATQNATAAVVTLRDNAANTNVAVTITGSGTAGTYCDTTHSAAVNANDLVDIGVTSHATAAVSGWSIEFDPAGGAVGTAAISGLGTATASNTIDNTSNAQNWQWSTLGAGNGLALSSTSTAAATSAQTLLNVALNGANGTSAQTTYGAQIANTHTGTSSTDIGLFATASGGTHNYAAIFSAGNVGVGSTTPGQVLDVQGTVRMKNFTLTGNGAATGYVLTSDSNGDGTWTSGSGTVGIGTANQEAVYTGSTAIGSGIITDNGTNVGIGSTNPAQALDVNGGFRSTLAGNSYINGDLGIGTNASPTAVLYIPSLEAVNTLTVVQHAVNYTSGSSSSTSVTVSSTGSGHLLVAMLYSVGTATGVTDGTNSFTHFSGTFIPDGDVWYLPSSSSGKTSITVNFSGSVAGTEMEVWEVSGFVTPQPDVSNGATGLTQSGGFAIGEPVTTTSTEGFVAAVDISNDSVTGPAPGNNFTAGGDQDANGNAFISLISRAIGTYTPVWTDNGTSFVSFTAAFKETASSPPRYLCIDTTGRVSSSVTACSGT